MSKASQQKSRTLLIIISQEPKPTESRKQTFVGNESFSNKHSVKRWSSTSSKIFLLFHEKLKASSSRIKLLSDQYFTLLRSIKT